ISPTIGGLSGERGVERSFCPRSFALAIVFAAAGDLSFASAPAAGHAAAFTSAVVSLSSRRRQASATPATQNSVPAVIHPIGLLLNILAPLFCGAGFQPAS